MRIAVIGAGDVGSALGEAWTKKGHEVCFGVRHPDSDEIRSLLASIGKSAKATTVAEACRAAEIVVLAVPWNSVQQVLATAGDLSGKVLIDCTNPLKPDLSGLLLGHTTSAGEQVAAWARGAHVVKTFNHSGANNMAAASGYPLRPVMFVCGDHEPAKRRVLQLVEDLGFDPVDAGPMQTARLLEPLAMLWIHLAFACHLGRDIAFALMHRRQGKTSG